MDKFVSYDTLVFYHKRLMIEINDLKNEVALLREEIGKKNDKDYIVKDEGYYYPFGRF